jgi:hypothetical protein
MSKNIAGTIALLFCAGVSFAVWAEEREMNVQQGPEAVFSVPVASIFPVLETAEATGRNGRVGDELVFWGYRLGDGRQVDLVACAETADVDCAARERQVCPSGMERLAQTTAEGLVRRRHCTRVATVAPGELHPGCTDRDAHRDLVVSLVQCG